MSLAVELLERRTRINPRKDPICESTNADELFAFLQNEYDNHPSYNDTTDRTIGEEEVEEDEIEFLKNGELIDCYVKKLEDTIKFGKIGYKNSKKEITDYVELNILIEKSLLDYELKLSNTINNNINNNNDSNSNNNNTPNDKKIVFDINRLEYLLNDEFKDMDNQTNNNNNNNTIDLSILKHYVELLKLGYAPDLNTKETKSINDQQFLNNNIHLMDELVSTILSLAVQKNIDLPSIDSNKVSNSNGRIEWFKECIYKVANNGNDIKDNNDNSHKKSIDETNIYNNTNDNETALKDLQFAHSYLTKKYEEEMSQHSKYVSDLINKNKHCEELLKNTTLELAKVTNQQLRLELQNTELTEKLDEKTKELHEVEMNNNLLKVEYLGLLPATSLMSPPSSDNGNFSSPVLQSSSEFSSQTTTPTTPTTALSSTDATSSVSVRILRMEFKKIVEQMNSRFSKELEQERLERKRVEKLLALRKEQINV